MIRFAVINGYSALLLVTVLCACTRANAETTSPSSKRPNILYIMSDDHAAHAISCYGSKINKTPNIDRIAAEGMRLTNCFATNALCAPSRATILTSKYSHLNGVRSHGSPPFDGTQVTFPTMLKQAGYQTAVIGKWHLKSNPMGFDYYNVLPGQGQYVNPRFIDMGTTRTVKGYATDLITDFSIDWLEKRDPGKPFLLLCHHKAPHREWTPDAKHATMYENEEIPKPPTFDDDYSHRASPARNAKMRIESDLSTTDVKTTPPQGLAAAELKNWHYQRYIKDYLRCVASVDDNVGRLLDYLKANNLLENTIVIYTSDQGFFLGDHGWYDKRFMYEESMRMPFVVRYPKEIKAGSASDAFIINADFGPTLLDFAQVPRAAEMQGESFRPWLRAQKPAKWRDAVYYHFFEYPDHDHLVARHYGIRTDRYKLVHYYHPVDEWELFDLEKDPQELRSVYDDPAQVENIALLKTRLKALREQYQDPEDKELLK
ncbi:MAG: sulfatase family protein [Candidatus Sumerlaeaceae bacterium]